MTVLKRKAAENKLTAMMIVHNEAERFLREVLDQISLIADKIVILDDASTDDTPEICSSYPKVIMHRNEQNMFFEHEARLRAKLWKLATATEPDWIMAIDADEIFEERIYGEIDYLINQTDYDGILFRLFDFWGGTTHYRTDGSWNPWSRFTLLLARYFPEVTCTWPDIPFHCGRWPQFYRGHNLIAFQSDIRVKHYGWSSPEMVTEKYLSYRGMDPDGKYLSREHLESVMAPAESVKLEEWIPAKPLPY